MGKIVTVVKNVGGKEIKIAPGYVPKVKSRRLKPSAQVCPKCKQLILTSQMPEHIRIELLDPKWKEQKAKALEKSKETNLADNLTVFENLKQLAQARPDIFGGDELNLQTRIKEILRKDQEKQKVVWDGHTASIGSLAQKLGSTMEVQMVDYCKGLEEQYAKVQEIGPRVIPNSVSRVHSASIMHDLPRTALEFQAQAFSAVPQRYASSIYSKTAALQLHQTPQLPIHPTNSQDHHHTLHTHSPYV